MPGSGMDRSIIEAMSRAKGKPEAEPSEELTKFQRLAKALFRVDKNDVDKRENQKRTGSTSTVRPRS